MIQRSYLHINYSNFAHANEAVIPPVIYRDLVMEKPHFPDTRVGMELVIPTPQALPPMEMVLNPVCIGRSGGVPLLAPSPGRTDAGVSQPEVLPSPSNRLGGNHINTAVIKTGETGVWG